MSYERLGNYRVRERCVRDGREVRKKRSLFDKVSEIKQHLKVLIPEVRDEELLVIFSRCRLYYEGRLHYGRRLVPENELLKRELTLNERAVYDYLLRNRLNPSTAYRWLLATRLPQDIREQLAKGRIGQKLAMQIAANRRFTKHSTLGLLMMEDIRNVIQKLDWRE